VNLDRSQRPEATINTNPILFETNRFYAISTLPLYPAWLYPLIWTALAQLSSAAGHITRATASAICFHCDSSTTSCFRPLSVSR
jgi:hypothetical protein